MLSFEEMLRRYSVEQHASMRRITRPLKDHFRIDYFGFHQVKEDGRFFSTSNCAEFNEFYFAQPEIRAHNPYAISPRFVKEGFYDFTFQDFPGHSKVEKFFREQVHVDCVITKFQKINDGYRIYTFGFSKALFSLANCFLNDPIATNSYIGYFTQENRNMLKKGEDDAVDLIAEMGENFQSPSYFMRENSEVKQAYYKSLSLNETDNFSSPTFTIREQECLRCCFDGLTAAQIGQKLFLSKRTVEHRTEQIKVKLRCNKKSEIVSAVRRLIDQGLINPVLHPLLFLK